MPRSAHLLISESNFALSVLALMHSSSGSCTTNSSTKESGMLNSWRREWYLHSHSKVMGATSWTESRRGSILTGWAQVAGDGSCLQGVVEVVGVGV